MEKLAWDDWLPRRLFAWTIVYLDNCWLGRLFAWTIIDLGNFNLKIVL
jgi:hypothetical protein